MSDSVLFRMWEPFRQSLIDSHLFYVDQARKRLISQFDDIESAADKAADEWLERSKHRFDPDRDDPGSFYETANEVRIEFYGLLGGMRDQTRLSVVAGMLHGWDKQLRDWLVGEIKHWHSGDNIPLKVWSVDFGDIADLLESLGWKIRNASYFPVLDACRLVVNVYKHGEGKSFIDLKQNYPECLDAPFQSAGGAISGFEYRDHTHLRVSDKQLQAFSDAIVAFWQGVPESIYPSQTTDVPRWFERAILNDQIEQEQARQK